MTIYDPFPADVETWLQESIQHLYEAKIIPPGGAPFQVAMVERYDLTFDMDWSPFAQATMTIKTPTDPAQLAALDPRLDTRVQLRSGYRWGGVDYWAPMATLRLHSTSSPHPGGTTDLTAHGGEMPHQNQYAPVETATSFDNYPAKTGVYDFVRSWIRRAFEPGGPYPDIVSGIPGGSWGLDVVKDWKSSGNSYFEAIQYAAEGAGLWIFEGGHGPWYIVPRPTLGTDYAGRFRDGKRGTITSAETSMNREEWFNDVFLQYDYVQADGVTPSTITGSAQVTSGPLAVTNMNQRTYFRHYTVPWPVSETNAKAVAQYRLAQLMLRGRQRSFTAAATYWLRPGMTILVKLGRAKYDRLLVAAVTFSPLTGSMTVRTVRPEDYEMS